MNVFFCTDGMIRFSEKASVFYRKRSKHNMTGSFIRVLRTDHGARKQRCIYFLFCLCDCWNGSIGTFLVLLCQKKSSRVVRGVILLGFQWHEMNHL